MNLQHIVARSPEISPTMHDMENVFHIISRAMQHTEILHIRNT